MSRSKDKLELFWVMSDALSSEDEAQRDQAVLVLWSLFNDVCFTMRHERILRAGKREMRKLSFFVWTQLQTEGYLKPKRNAVAVYVKTILDGIALTVHPKELPELRKAYHELSKRLRLSPAVLTVDLLLAKEKRRPAGDPL